MKNKTHDEYWLDLDHPDRYAELYGPDWRQLPVVYGSLGMNGDDRNDRKEEQETIARLLHPHFLYVSPYRGCGGANKFRSDNHYGGEGVLNPRHCTARDYGDVRRARLVLLNMAAPKRKMIITKITDDVLKLYRPEEYECLADRLQKVGETTIDVPLTGTIAEVMEAKRLNIPVIGYNCNRPSDQMFSPFVVDAITIQCVTYQQAIEYIVTNWFV